MSKKSRKKSEVKSTAVTTEAPLKEQISTLMKHEEQNRSPAIPRRRAEPAEGQFLSTPVGKILYRVFRILASLQLAIILLSLWTACLIKATVIESRQSTEIAKQLIYNTWWFVLLLTLLGINVLCAALKKMDPERIKMGMWPWKKYQTGFLVTHLGLITLVFGGLLTNIGGIEGQVRMADTPNKALQDRLLPQTSDSLILEDYRLVCNRLGRPVDKEEQQKAQAVLMLALEGRLQGQRAKELIHELSAQTTTATFRPGGLPWREDKYYKASTPWDLRMLQKIANPDPTITKALGNNLTLELTDFWPFTDEVIYQRAETKEEKKEAFPVARLEISSTLFLQPIVAMVAALEQDLPESPKALSETLMYYIARKQRELQYSSRYGNNAGSIPVEMFRASSDEQVTEFNNPPNLREIDGKTIGEKGQLVVYLGEGAQRKPYRVPVSDKLLNAEKGIPLGDSGWTIQLKKQGNYLNEPELKELLKPAFRAFDFPMVRFELSRDGKTREYIACARIPNLKPYQGKGEDPEKVTVWYHYPNGFWNDDAAKGALHLLVDVEGGLHYLSFDQSGYPVGPGHRINKTEKIRYVLPWRKAMSTSFVLENYYPLAIGKNAFEPVNLARIGAESPDSTDGGPLYTPAIAGNLIYKGKALPFRYRLGSGPALVVDRNPNDPEFFFLWLDRAAKPLDFSITLNRAIERKDPGSMRSASFKSLITITDKDEGAGNEPSDHELYMNHTVDHDGYRLFQADFKATGILDEKLGRNVNISGIQVARDPGRLFKYGGTFTVVLGIFLMFYMKAYFFKPSGRRLREEDKSANDFDEEIARIKTVPKASPEN